MNLLLIRRFKLKDIEVLIEELSPTIDTEQTHYRVMCYLNSDNGWFYGELIDRGVNPINIIQCAKRVLLKQQTINKGKVKGESRI